MSVTQLRLLMLGVGVLCALGVVVGVVATGTDGHLTDLLALATVAAFVIAGRLQRRVRQESVRG